MRLRYTKEKQWYLQSQEKHIYLLVILHVIGMLLIYHLYLIVCHFCVTRVSFVCHSYVYRMYSYVIRMSLVCTRMSFVCHSYVFVCHSYVLVCYSYVTRIYLHVIRMYLYVIHMSLLVCHSYVFLPWTLLQFLLSFLSKCSIFRSSSPDMFKIIFQNSKEET